MPTGLMTGSETSSPHPKQKPSAPIKSDSGLGTTEGKAQGEHRMTERERERKQYTKNHTQYETANPNFKTQDEKLDAPKIANKIRAGIHTR